MSLRTFNSLRLLGAALILPMTVAGHSFAQKRRHRSVHKRSAFIACLPPDVKANEIAVYGYNTTRNVTVAEKVKELKGRCRNGRIVGPGKKEIRFFRFSCWGNPPSNYQESQAVERRTLKVLQAKHTVIVISCDPRIP